MKKNVFSWLVIGSGPAGIASIGKLLDQGIPEHEIAWIDPVFQVGDLGGKWQFVPSNTKVSLFIKYLNNCQSFVFSSCEKNFNILNYNLNDHCQLKEIVSPLQWITERLKEKVYSFNTHADALQKEGKFWRIITRAQAIFAKNIVLCTGAEPKQLAHGSHEIIPLETALKPHLLKKEIHQEDIVGVFGSSHSAVLAMANLLPCSPKKIYNFYRSPHRYAVELNDWILFDDSGLKGFAANWAKKHLDGEPPKNFQRCRIDDTTFEESFALCNKIIYAVGFETRKTPVIEPYLECGYQKTTGIIAPGIFGLGIAYPQTKYDPLGNLEYRVGLWKFMDYLNTVLPMWLIYAQ